MNKASFLGEMGLEAGPSRSEYELYNHWAVHPRLRMNLKEAIEYENGVTGGPLSSKR